MTPLGKVDKKVPDACVGQPFSAFVHSGVLECARVIFFRNGPAFYNVWATIFALLCTARLDTNPKISESSNVRSVQGRHGAAPQIIWLRQISSSTFSVKAHEKCVLFRQI